MKAIYAPLFPTIEQHYRTTLAKCAIDAQRWRLAMFGDNLIQLHFALRQAALISEEPKSIFHRGDDAFDEFISDMESTFSLYRDNLGIDHGPILKGEYRRL